MKFYKYNGAGNDFIILNNLVEGIPKEAFPALARRLCERHLSIGADGLMLVERSDRADFYMAFYNADGSEGEMCGNGARCICRFGYESGLSGEEQTVETVSGLIYGRRIDSRRYRVRLTEPSVVRPYGEVTVEGKPYSCGYVELGVPGLPHAVVPLPGLRDADEHKLFLLGKAIRSHPDFPKGANVNFYDFLGPNHVYERTFERGVEDFTYACGTGTASVAVVLASRGEIADTGFTAEVRGGTLGIDLERTDSAITGVYLTGPTNFVAEGQVRDEDLALA